MIYIAFEGTDGQGKTTLINDLKKIRPDFLYVKEPWSQPYIKKIKTAKPEELSSLFARDREVLMRTEVVDAIRRNQVVVSDRSVFSSYAYQGAYDLSKTYSFGSAHGCDGSATKILVRDDTTNQVLKDIIHIQTYLIPDVHVIWLRGDLKEALERSGEVINCDFIKKELERSRDGIDYGFMEKVDSVYSYLFQDVYSEKWMRPVIKSVEIVTNTSCFDAVSASKYIESLIKL
jgi:deoxyadenosine/deoxycytidine kinase